MVEKRRVLRMMAQVIRKALRTVTMKHNFRDVSITECTEILLESISKIAREHATILETTGEEFIDSQEYDDVMENQELDEVMDNQECDEVMENQSEVRESDELINELIEELSKQPSYQQYDELFDMIDEAIKILSNQDETTQDISMHGSMMDKVMEESDTDQDFPDFNTLMEIVLDNENELVVNIPFNKIHFYSYKMLQHELVLSLA